MMFAVRLSGNFFDSVWGMSVQGLILEILVGMVVFPVLALIWCAASRDEHLTKVLGQIKRG